MLLNLKSGWQDQWKVLTLLTYAAGTPEGRRQSGEIITAAAEFVLRGGFVGTAALDLISGVPAPARSKWEVLFPILQTAPADKASQLVRRLAELTPPENRDRTAEAVGDILAFTTQSSLISASVDALKTLNSRSQLPRLRDMLAEAAVEKANSLAQLLSYFGDREAVPAIRQAIATWRYGAKSIEPLVSSLSALEGPSCQAFLAELLDDGQPQLQRQLLTGVLNKSADPAVLAAVGRLAVSAADPGVRELAEKHLGAHPGKTA
jgi:hypothetical protein